MPFVDFGEVKERVSIQETVSLLGLDMKLRGHQLRGPCPACKSGGDRALVVTPDKGLFYCFARKTGGDQLALTAHIKGISVKDAAEFLGGTVPVPSKARGTVPVTVPGTVPQNQKGELNPLTYLEPGHEAVLALGISKETADRFGAGYANKGVLRGRFAVPVKSKDGRLLAYVGIATKPEQSPRLLFHNFDPTSVIFNAERVEAGGDLYLLRDPIEVLKAYEAGVENVVGFLTEGATPQQFEMLAAFMDEKQTELAYLP